MDLIGEQQLIQWLSSNDDRQQEISVSFSMSAATFY